MTEGAKTLEPGLRVIRAPNPSPMTYTGTMTYLLGTGDIAVIDPGPALPQHLDAILNALQPGQRISHILVTHSHLDHSPLAATLAARTGAPVSAFGPATAGRSTLMETLAHQDMVGGGEGVDTDFAPEVALNDGDVIAGDGWSLTARWTPGHMANHLSFAWGDALFSGDHVMGWATSLVSPPDGDLTQFMASCRALAKQPWRVFYPGHGDPVCAPNDRLEELMAHRETRTEQILKALAEGANTPKGLTQRIYTDVAPALWPAAERNVLAHLIDLTTQNRTAPVGDLSPDAHFQLL